MPIPRKPTAGFWIVVVMIVLLVGYPLSFGPACWIGWRSQFGRKAVIVLYTPILWLGESNGSVRSIIERYATVFGHPWGVVPSRRGWHGGVI